MSNVKGYHKYSSQKEVFVMKHKVNETQTNRYQNSSENSNLSGQLISKCPFDLLVSSNLPKNQQNLKDFCPSL